jgi:glycosyltransferase involved in cell wall biosynthesis
VPPLVSVITLTYNQEEFLPQCLAGVRAQKGDFELEHIVVDDASTDETAAILDSYASKFDGVVLVRHGQNMGANAGMAEAYARCRGEFVATCEGDDWWLSPEKLSAQIAYMRRRPDLAMCYHDAVVVYEGRKAWPQVKPGFGAPIQTMEELLEDNRAHTCTVMYRRMPGFQHPDWYAGHVIGDWPNHAFHAAKGAIGYLPRPLAAYRVHGRGSWTSLEEERRVAQLSAMLRDLDAHFVFRHSERIEATIHRIESDLRAGAQAA